MKRIILSLAILSFFLIGCDILTPSTGTKSNNVLQIELYDAQGKLITGSLFTAGAIVNDVPDVKYMSVVSTIKNNGNTPLKLGFRLTAPQIVIDRWIIASSIDDFLRLNLNDQSDLCVGQVGRVMCTSHDYTFLPNTAIKMYNNKIDVDSIGVGTHKISIEVKGFYKDENGVEQVVESGKEILLNIQPDPIKAGIIVDIGTSSNTPPPPCVLNCPSGMMWDGDKCISDPIHQGDILMCESGVYNPQTNKCELMPVTVCMVS